ncbi:hypothetical protein B0J12DRAFT_697034 [Macrophomina phaseolina]|uniref:Uncharacterized protein n=1 Tax=Macrophomina phaseolina TaxID=35725 RepID=A0ABQ8GIP3_9PEZI|nr:hypothetical protein B0J12DRAFT_697034 [Macrophomina phaseolina]
MPLAAAAAAGGMKTAAPRVPAEADWIKSERVSATGHVLKQPLRRVSRPKQKAPTVPDLSRARFPPLTKIPQVHIIPHSRLLPVVYSFALSMPAHAASDLTKTSHQQLLGCLQMGYFPARAAARCTRHTRARSPEAARQPFIITRAQESCDPARLRNLAPSPSRTDSCQDRPPDGLTSRSPAMLPQQPSSARMSRTGPHPIRRLESARATGRRPRRVLLQADKLSIALRGRGRLRVHGSDSMMNRMACQGCSNMMHEYWTDWL